LCPGSTAGHALAVSLQGGEYLEFTAKQWALGSEGLEDTAAYLQRTRYSHSVTWLLHPELPGWRSRGSLSSLPTCPQVNPRATSSLRGSIAAKKLSSLCWNGRSSGRASATWPSISGRKT